MHPCLKVLRAVQAAKASGNLDLEKLLDMKEAGIDVESFVSEEMRLQMYQKEVRFPSNSCQLTARQPSDEQLHTWYRSSSNYKMCVVMSGGQDRRDLKPVGMQADSDAQVVPAQVASVLSSGTGEFNEERILKELPAQLQLPERRVKSVINGQASDRKRDVLVQAVSMLRQRKLDEVVKCLNNLLACNKVKCDFTTVEGNGPRLEAAHVEQSCCPDASCMGLPMPAESQSCFSVSCWYMKGTQHSLHDPEFECQNPGYSSAQLSVSWELSLCPQPPAALCAMPQASGCKHTSWMCAYTNCHRRLCRPRRLLNGGKGKKCRTYIRYTLGGSRIQKSVLRCARSWASQPLRRSPWSSWYSVGTSRWSRKLKRKHSSRQANCILWQQI